MFGPKQALTNGDLHYGMGSYVCTLGGGTKGKLCREGAGNGTQHGSTITVQVTALHLTACIAEHHRVTAPYHSPGPGSI